MSCLSYRGFGLARWRPGAGWGAMVFPAGLPAEGPVAGARRMNAARTPPPKSPLGPDAGSGSTSSAAAKHEFQTNHPQRT